ncbi:MAG: hypothetical protein UW76_C0017G0024 [Parcubacteria group bacterium GW2011_GWF2_44_8b]|nr:MAG: hypothetical protein UV94_C0002G0028 [Parcubacteria group bacterium GW2011_GWC1_43_30]KKT80050.1 MAG: hypothetical protein UW76_C0017G0024 [Parcubacteria group bacterium GW2011_GWF2_44_8b]KKT85957.1 MAG: hypothetical protein UW83_C0005G0017 [Parcubacteria group bacterium GW2011_GWD1_44_9]
MENEKKDNPYILPIAVIVAGIMVAGAMVYNNGNRSLQAQTAKNSNAQNVQAILADGGSILPLEAEEKMLATLVANGSTDPSKLPQVTELNLLWAYGLANKNQVLESGPIMDPRYGGPTNMASVGGWTVTTGSVMNHYSKHILATLTPDQQSFVEKIVKGIYRPCCNNSTHFPDCNHGMAMLGLLEYLASQGATEGEMWNAAITANMRWFPDQYQTIAQYLKIKGIDSKTVTPQMLLGAEYSSGSGFARIAAQVPQSGQQGGGSGCGVGTGETVVPRGQQGGCGI